MLFNCHYLLFKFYLIVKFLCYLNVHLFENKFNILNVANLNNDFIYSINNIINILLLNFLRKIS